MHPKTQEHLAKAAAIGLALTPGEIATLDAAVAQYATGQARLPESYAEVDADGEIVRWCRGQRIAGWHRVEPEAARRLGREPTEKLRLDPETGRLFDKASVRLTASRARIIAGGGEVSHVSVVGVPPPVPNVALRVNGRPIRLARGELLEVTSEVPGLYFIDLVDRRLYAQPRRIIVEAISAEAAAEEDARAAADIAARLAEAAARNGGET